MSRDKKEKEDRELTRKYCSNMFSFGLTKKKKKGTSLFDTEEAKKNGHRDLMDGWFYSVTCHPRNCVLCARFPYNPCFRNYTPSFPKAHLIPDSGYCKYDDSHCKYNNAFVMDRIYGSSSLKPPVVVGKMFENGDWREYITVVKDLKGFSYLYVQLNNYEMSEAKRKHNYLKRYGWVVFEVPHVRYHHDEDNKIVLDSQTPRAQLQIYNKNLDESPHYSACKRFH